MHIGFLAPDLMLTHGWGSYTLGLLRALQRAGVAITVITARNSPAVADVPALPLLPAVVPAESHSLFKMLRQSPAVARHLAGCDMLHTTIEPYAPLAAGLKGRRPLFITVHGTYVYLPKMRRFPVNYLYQWAFRQATLVCVSHYTARIAQEVVPGVHTIVINNAVEAERFGRMTSPPDPLSRLERGDITPLILTTGGLKARKGTLHLVRAVAKVRDHLPDVQCIIAGALTHDPDYVTKVRDEIARLKLTDCVHLTGVIPDDELRAWYRKASVFVMPSINDGWKFEGFGLVHLEASAAGLPVIGTTGCGAEDAIEHGVTGLLVDQARIAEMLPEAILEILLNPETVRQMGSAGREKARRQTWDNVALQMIAAYEASLRRSG